MRRLTFFLLLLLSYPCAAHADDPGTDILARLQAIAGMTVHEEVSPRADYRFFIMSYDQPADHAHPEGQRFQQRLTLLHRDDTAPTVLYTSGYFVSSKFGRAQLTGLLSGNQIAVEHRFFSTSIPAPADWRQLTIRQSAADFHRIVQALKPIYQGRWVSTGGSKGGETVVYHRRFYPHDVDATVAYVAPLPLRNDPRFIAFMDHVGDAACRQKLYDLQQAMIDRRGELVPLMLAVAAAQGQTYAQLGAERAFEHAVEEMYFAFWQYGDASMCDAVPPPDASTTALFDYLDEISGVATFSDQQIAAYEPYYYQASTQIGYPAAYDYHLRGLHYRGSDVAPPYVSRPLTPYDYLALFDVQLWVATEAERLIFVYGGNDPWSAAAYALGWARDSYFYKVPGGNHSANILALSDAERAEALAALERWTGVSVTLPTPSLLNSIDPPLEEFSPRRKLGR